MSSDFTHLHVHSHYSLLNALPKIPDLVAAAKEFGMEALALTDNGNLYAAIEFYKECKSAGLKPIIGVDFYVAVRTRNDREPGIDNRRHRLVLLAKNFEGYQNLLKLVTYSHTEGFYYKPRIDRELMGKYPEHLIAIIPSFSGETSAALKNKDAEKAELIVDEYKKIYGKDNVYLEITHHPEIDGHEGLMGQIEKLGIATDTPLVAAHDTYYLKPEDRRARETMIAIQNQGVGAERGSFNDQEEDFSFIDQKTAEKYFKKNPEAIANTKKIADQCSLELTLGKWVFPKIKVDSGLSYDDELRRIAYDGIASHNLEKTKEVIDRVEYELKVIADKGYSPYFLIVSDLLRFAREKGILTTTRGSAAGSLVSYLSYITTVNPLEYKLPFERFLNPERPKAPDIDMDMADNRRDEMIAYTKEKYGHDRVAQIGTFGTMMARGSVRDVARALGYPYSLGDRIAKLIPMGSQGFPMSIDKALDETPELKEMYKKESEVREIIDLAKKIEGCARHISVHAAGVVIAPSPIVEWCPLQFDTKDEGKLITQYDMYAITDEYGGVGLLKFDFLGIRNLAILADSVKLVKAIHGIDIDIANIPVDDKKTFEMLAKGETLGLFQLNGSGMTHFLKELRPTTIHDINAMVALYRPGPMEVIPEYIERKNNPKLIKYLDPRMEKYLKESYGLLVYQDDLLYSAIELAGYSWLEVDQFRKAIGKKIPAEMEAQKEKFTKGVIANGQTAAFAEKVWKLFEPFAAYGFNKAHAASYGKVAYQTAYMKANFPVEYMSAILTAESGDVEKISEIVAGCKHMNIPILPPDINESFGGFTVINDSDQGKEQQKIRFGLYTIKNFGEGIADAIIAIRKESGKFTSLADFLTRVRDRNLNKKSLEALIKAGALDAFGERGTMLGNIETILEFNKAADKQPKNQDSLFGGMPESITPTLTLESKEDVPIAQKLAWEKELLGLYISGHPLDAFREKLEKRDMSVKKIREELKPGMMTVISGIIEELKPIVTKGGDRMAFIKVADFTGSLEVVIFPKIFTEYAELMIPEKCLAIKGRISERNGELSIIAEKIKAL